MPTYHKLIRDKIPEIIAAEGKECTTQILSDAAYLKALNQKLGEELVEYQQAGDLSELADLVEVVYAIVQHHGQTIDEFEKLRQEKRAERGGFERKLWLVSVSE